MKNAGSLNKILTIAALGLCFSLPAGAHVTEGVDTHATVLAEALPSGMLVRESNGTRVYYLQNSLKRWIQSGTAFDRQGFRWADVVTVGAGELNGYFEGEPIVDDTPIGLPVTLDLLPDLAPAAPYGLRYVVQNGRILLKFTGTFWNRGKGAMELNADAAGTAGDGEFQAAQRIFRADGTSRDRAVGVLYWHAVHDHYHYDEFGEYSIEQIGGNGVVSHTQKTTFCMRDDTSMLTPAEGAKQPRTYGGCKNQRQGVSVGWADVYPSTLPDQYFDVTNMPAGVYKLSFRADPHAHFLELRRDNNIASTVVQIDPAKRTLKIIGEAAGFVTSSNTFIDGTLVKAVGDPKVYVMVGNKKRHIPNEAAFVSAGYSWSAIIELPRAAVDLIADTL